MITKIDELIQSLTTLKEKYNCEYVLCFMKTMSDVVEDMGCDTGYSEEDLAIVLDKYESEFDGVETEICSSLTEINDKMERFHLTSSEPTGYDGSYERDDDNEEFEDENESEEEYEYFHDDSYYNNRRSVDD